ncbi:hypothetical protein TTHERM_00227440 (macronuclear) [Tetrahymena thermophila SB210]|uniref:Uncharacterized protein n=1 Tax=Tetrahymena thermophila (strain SB210) TaxID=312017 RepID=Q23BT8_TETTS|nr:hypothetical protein TTHERM_00227440 [Tetrahymena thermophila SB210]EAR94030.1 hypothetical protein TTHERM_00227440 [Tetrahymena thermophila SB210]|eukprot:XP_001014275.1 hypothetical protein TTHERM_00227440 [Tetrahymena thermophila SB210]
MSNNQLKELPEIQVQREESYDIFQENGDIQLDKREELEDNTKQEKVEEESSDYDDENLSDILSEELDSNDQLINQLNNPHFQSLVNQAISVPNLDKFGIDFPNINAYPLRRLVSQKDQLEVNSSNSLNHIQKENYDISLGEQSRGSEGYLYNRNRGLQNLIQSADGQIMSQNNLQNSDQPRIIQIIGEKYEKNHKFYKVLWSDRQISIEDVSVVNDYKQLKDEYELQVQQFLDMSHINRIDSREKISIFARRKRKICIEQKKKKISDQNKQKYRIKKLITEGNLTPEDVQKIHEERKMRRKKIERRKNKELLDIKAEQSEVVIPESTQRSYITRRRNSSIAESRPSISQQKPSENGSIQQKDDQKMNENCQNANELEQEQNQNTQIEYKVEKIEEENKEIEDDQNEQSQSQSQEEFTLRKRRTRSKKNNKIINFKQTQIQTENIEHKSDQGLNQIDNQQKSQIQEEEFKEDKQVIQGVEISKNLKTQENLLNSEDQISQSNKLINNQNEQSINKAEEVNSNVVCENQINQQSLKKNGQPKKIHWKKLIKMTKEQNTNTQIINPQQNKNNQIKEDPVNSQENEEQIDNHKTDIQIEHISQNENSQEIKQEAELNKQNQLNNTLYYSKSLKKDGQPRKIQWKQLAKMLKEKNDTTETNLHNQNIQSEESAKVRKQHIMQNNLTIKNQTKQELEEKPSNLAMRSKPINKLQKKSKKPKISNSSSSEYEKLIQESLKILIESKRYIIQEIKIKNEDVIEIEDDNQLDVSFESNYIEIQE